MMMLHNLECQLDKLLKILSPKTIQFSKPSNNKKLLKKKRALKRQKLKLSVMRQKQPKLFFRNNLSMVKSLGMSFRKPQRMKTKCAVKVLLPLKLPIYIRKTQLVSKTVGQAQIDHQSDLLVTNKIHLEKRVLLQLETLKQLRNAAAVLVNIKLNYKLLILRKLKDQNGPRTLLEYHMLTETGAKFTSNSKLKSHQCTTQVR